MNSMFRRILPAQVEVDETDPRQISWDARLLFEREHAFIENAIDSRRQEFLAGRVMARSAMARLGLPRMEVPAGPDRSPIWPEGVTGSISHTKDWCGAAVARKSDIIGLGIDVEEATPLSPELIPVVLTEPEKLQLGNSALLAPGVLAKLIFCAKEAAYKAQYAITKTFLEFEALNVVINEDGLHWHAEFNPGFRPPSLPTNTIPGQWHLNGNLIAASAVLRS